MVYVKTVDAPFHFWTVLFFFVSYTKVCKPQIPLCLILHINYELFQ